MQIPLTNQHLAFDLADAAAHMEQVDEKLKAKDINLSEVGDIRSLMDTLCNRLAALSEEGKL